MDFKFLILVIFLLLVCGFSSHSSIRIFNPFNISVIFNLKCDYRNNKWLINKDIKLNKKSNILFNIPNGSNCQIWVKR